MKVLRVSKSWSRFAGGQAGTTFIETAVAMALLGIIAVALLSGLATASRASIIIDEQTTAESLARSQMEWAKMTAYTVNATAYSPAPIPVEEDYTGYAVSIAAASLNSPDDGIQKITVTVKHYDKDIIQLEGYKVDR